jgi:hypothetical protein
MATLTSPLITVFEDGAPANAALIYTYQSGTTTDATTYTNAALSVANTNPIVCNTNGEATLYIATTQNLRLVIKNSSGTTLHDLDPVYPSLILTGLTASVAELNILDGATLSTAELNILDGVTATAAELNILDGVTSSTAELNILDGVTSSTAELNILDGVTATTAEINKLAGVTGGTTTASKALVVDANKTLNELGVTKLIDSSGNEIIKTASVASAVNELTATNAITATNPSLAATGDDTNITAEFSGKGTGGVRLKAPGNGAPLKLNKNANGFDVSFDLATLTANRTITIPDSSITLAAQNWERISSTTASSSATVDFTDLSSTYLMYMAVLAYVTPATDLAELWLRMDENNGASFDAGASDYRYGSQRLLDNSATSTIQSAGAAQIEIATDVGNGGAEACAGRLFIYNPIGSAGKYPFIDWYIPATDGSGFSRINLGSGIKTTNSAGINAIRFMFSTGNIATGIFTLYGLRAS